MSSIFRVQLIANSRPDEFIVIATKKAAHDWAASEVSCYGYRGYVCEHIGHADYTATEGDKIKVIGG